MQSLAWVSFVMSAEITEKTDHAHKLEFVLNAQSAQIR